MSTIMDFYNSGLAARQNQIKNKYLDPMLEAKLYAAQTQNKYLSPSLAAQLYEAQTKNKYLDQNQAAQLSIAQTKSQYLPEQFQLNNEHQRQENKFYGPEHQAIIDEKNFFVNHPLLKMPGAAGQIGAALYLRNEDNKEGGLSGAPSSMQSNDYYSDQHQGGGLGSPLNIPPRQNYSNLILGNLNTLNRARNAHADLDTARTNNYNWAQLPAETRNNLVAQGLGMGVDPVRMKNYVNQGMSIQQIANKEGLDPNNIPPPVYFPTSTTKTRIQQVQQVGAELDYMSSATTPIISKYANTFMGKSPKLIFDMLSSDPEKQKQFGKYIGSMAVQAELANGRVFLAGGRSGIEIIRDLRAKSLQGIDNLSPIKMTDIAFTEAQNTIDQILQKGAKIRSITGMSPFSQNNNAPALKDPKNMTTEEIQAELANG